MLCTDDTLLFDMRQTLKHIPILRSISVYLLLLVLPGIADASSPNGPVVVTIKPLYSLVAQLTEGIEEPVLLMKQMPSPHHYSMRPSERRLLSDARVIVWIGPQMETSLSKIISQQDSLVITAMQADGVKRLERRTKHGHQHTSDETPSSQTNTDPHIWLSIKNAIAISKHVSKQLISSDPANTARYQANLQQLINRITRLSANINTDLDGNRQPYITYHDAYQYFEEEHQLNHIDSISFDEEAGISLKHLRHIESSIRNNGIRCLLYQPPKPDIVDTLSKQTEIKIFALDPLGLDLEDEKEAWFKIIQATAASFKQCLAN